MTEILPPFFVLTKEETACASYRSDEAGNRLVNECWDGLRVDC